MTVRRFVSPGRIAVLMLIDMYCSRAVHEDDDDFILALITAYISDGYARPTSQRQRYLARWQRALLSVDLLADLRSLRPALQRCFVPFRSTADTTPLRATLWDDLMARIWLRLTSLDDFGPFFEGLQLYLAPTYAERRAHRELGLHDDTPAHWLRLDRRSPIGLLVYQACHEFGRLAFPGRCELWEDFARYRNPTRPDFNRMWPPSMGVASLLFDAVLTDGQDEWGARTDAVARVVFDRMAKDTSLSPSLDETERLVDLLVERERIGFRPSPQLRGATDHVLQGATLVPSQATFYRLLDAWRMGDIHTAYDQLHRYFDLVSRQGVGAAFGYNVGPMNKSVIQRDFGEHSNDLLSMLDAVHAGREARDYNSLRFALLWLYMYARVLPRHIRPHQLQGLAGEATDGRQVLPYVRDDAAAAHFHGHRALASLLEARVALSDGRPPLLAQTCLRDAARTIVQHGEVTLEGQLASTQMLFWDRMGHAPLAAVHGRAFLRNRQDGVPFDDAVRVASRLALQYAQRGAFAQAKAAMDRLNPEGLSSLKPQSMVRHVLTFVAAQQAVRARRFDDADDLLLRRLPAAGYPSCAPAAVERKAQGPAQMDPDLAVQAALLRVTSLARRADADADLAAAGDDADTGGGSLVAARDVLDSFEAAYDKGAADLHVLLQVALARADLYARAGRGLRAVSLLVRTLQACLRRRYHLLLWETVGAVARLLVAEGEFRAARTLLRLALPRSLESAHAETTAQLYEDLADACMGLAGRAARSTATSKRDRRTKQHMARAWFYLDQAQVCADRAGTGGAVRGELALKKQVILSVSRRMAVSVGA